MVYCTGRVKYNATKVKQMRNAEVQQRLMRRYLKVGTLKKVEMKDHVSLKFLYKAYRREGYYFSGDVIPLERGGEPNEIESSKIYNPIPINSLYFA